MVRINYGLLKFVAGLQNLLELLWWEGVNQIKGFIYVKNLMRRLKIQD